MTVRRVLACPDKFRGTATSAQAAAAIGRAAASALGPAARCDELPLSDGGEGFLDVLGGANRATLVMGPLGNAVSAEWRLRGRTAVIEMARASGLVLAGGPEGNDPVAATTAGTGQLIAAALDGGARRILVGHGGSATTDGGLAALREMSPLSRLRGVELVAAVDVTTSFVDAAETFGPQKGATPAQVQLLARRLERLAQVYLEDHGVDVTAIAGAGAAGGLAGGLAAVGARVESGFDLVADELDLDEAIAAADLVVTGEGFLDEASFEGKVVGGVLELAEADGTEVLVVVGDASPEAAALLEGRARLVTLVDAVGLESALADAERAIEVAVAGVLAGR